MRQPIIFNLYERCYRWLVSAEQDLEGRSIWAEPFREEVTANLDGYLTQQQIRRFLKAWRQRDKVTLRHITKTCHLIIIATHKEYLPDLD